MSEAAIAQPLLPRKPVLPVENVSHSIALTLIVSDHEVLAELLPRSEGRERDEYALTALRIGILALKHARGQIDADTVKREGEKLLQNLRTALDESRNDIHTKLTTSLTEYFDPKSGKFQERVDRLIKQDGELEQVMRRQVGNDGSELAKTLAAHVGENSPLMKLLNPEESNGLVTAIRATVSTAVDEEQQRILREFSLDNEQSALKRLVRELTDANGTLKAELASEIENVIQEFSLDKEDSALSRLVRRVETAEETITKEFSLDQEDSALSRLSKVITGAREAIDANLTLDKEDSALFRLKRELVAILDAHEVKVQGFQSDVRAALDAMTIQRKESARSTQHGNDFESAVCEFIATEVQKAGDIPTRTGKTTGLIKNNRVGDLVVELGADCSAAGEKYVVEAKEDTSYKLADALAEIEIARKNRGASVGLFVFSALTAPEGIERFARHGEDIVLVWDAQKIESDVFLRAGLSLAKALSVRKQKEQSAEKGKWDNIDAAILAVETELTRLGKMKPLTETIHSHSFKILDEIRKMANNLECQISLLRESVEALRNA